MNGTPIAVAGVAGRMGREVVGAIAAEPRARLTGALEAGGHPALGTEIGGVRVTADAAEAFRGAAAVIGFTTAPGALAVARAAAEARAALVLGTTGLSDADRSAIDSLADRIPVLVSSNMSVGVNVLLKIVEDVARLLASHRVSMEETHHTHKKDAPSGTALALAAAVGRGRGRDVPRASIVSRREGEVVGDHRIVWEGPGERIEIRHTATSRLLFAVGAVRAALFLAGKPAGRYAMVDVLGI